MLRHDYSATIDFQYKFFLFFDAPKTSIEDGEKWIKEFYKINPDLWKVWATYDEFINAWSKEYSKIIVVSNDPENIRSTFLKATHVIINAWALKEPIDGDMMFTMVYKKLYRFFVSSIGTKWWCHIDWHNLEVNEMNNGDLYIPQYNWTYDFICNVLIDNCDQRIQLHKSNDVRIDLLKMIDYGVPDCLLVKADKRTQENVVG